jgi:hypothetical protein
VISGSGGYFQLSGGSTIQIANGIYLNLLDVGDPTQDAAALWTSGTPHEAACLRGGGSGLFLGRAPSPGAW